MKISVAILVVALALLSVGCGGDDDATATGSTAEEGPHLPAVADKNDPRFANVTLSEGRDEPVVVPPDRPPPKKLLIRDIELGTGPVALRGDQVAIRYHGVYYQSGAEQFHGWKYPPSLVYELGSNNNGQAFEQGIVGMREGGLREVIIPSHLAFSTGTLDYIVELVRLEPAR
jgi:hypothetical protein